MLMYEANAFTGFEPTASQQQAADKMVASCQASIARHGWEDLEKALESGCNDYLTKPIDEEELWRKVEKLIGG